MENIPNISVIDPITPAWNHMMRILFKPFAFKKWLLLGFCAFLSQCGEAGGSNITNISYFRTSNSNIGEWVEANTMLFVTLICASILVIFIFVCFILWLASRGKFMLIDGIVKNRGAVSEPWNDYKKEGNSLCLLSIFIWIVYVVVFVIIVGLSLLIAMPDIQNGSFQTAGLLAVLFGSLTFILYIFASIAITFFLNVFVLPTMYLKRIKATEAFKLAWTQFCKDRMWKSTLLFLMMLMLGIGASTIGFFGILATCCLGALPYVNSVLFLPITLFFACYSLCYLQQFGKDWTFFKNLCRFCNYELHGLEDGCVCPECGKN